MNVSELILAAADVVKRGWCQGEYARDANGDRVGPLDQNAVTWCVLGALYRAFYEHFPETDNYKLCGKAEIALRRYIAQRTQYNSISAWNDVPSRTADEVIAMIQEAAKAAEVRS